MFQKDFYTVIRLFELSLMIKLTIIILNYLKRSINMNFDKPAGVTQSKSLPAQTIETCS